MSTYGFFLGEQSYEKIEKAKQYLLPMYIPLSELMEILDLTQEIMIKLLKFGAPHIQEPDNRIFINGVDLIEWLQAFNDFCHFEPWDSWYGVCKRCRKFVRMENPNLLPVIGEIIYDGGACGYCGDSIDNRFLASLITEGMKWDFGRVLWLFTKNNPKLIPIQVTHGG